MARNRRILMLLIALAAVAGTATWERLRVRGWRQPLEVAVHPVAMDAASAAFVSLRAEAGR